MTAKKSISVRLLVPTMCLAIMSGSALAGDGSTHGKSGVNGNGDLHGNAGLHGNGNSGNPNSDFRGQGRGNGNGNGGNGALASAFSKFASELKWMNSAHANQSARDHAAANSRTGRDGIYFIAALETLDAFTALQTADPELAETADIMTLEEAIEMLATTTDPVEQENAQLLVDYKVAQETEAEALDTASDGLTLSDTALNAYRSLLGV